MTTQTYTITLTDAELRLVRAGLAAHSIALEPETRTVIGDGAVAREAFAQRAACRDISLRLGELQLAALNPKFHHYVAVDAGGNKIGRCNLTADQLRIQQSNLICGGYIVKTAATVEPITESDEALLDLIKHPLI